VHSQQLVKNRILRQLLVDEIKSIQPWLTMVPLRSNVVLHEHGGPIEQIYFPLSGSPDAQKVMAARADPDSGKTRLTA
jgi:hypothetical protein